MPSRSSLVRAAALAAASLLSACRTPARPDGAAGRVPATVADGPVVVLLSFDGLGHGALDRGLPLPNLARLAARGVSARALVPSFPSLTFPNHVTLVTGLRPGRHGVVLNKMWDPERRASYASRDARSTTDTRWYTAEPLWVTAERQGVRTASFFWPASLAPVNGVRPSTSVAPYSDSVPDEARVDSLSAWLRRPPATRPRFVTLYVATVDQTSHRTGPASPATDSAIVAADRLVGRVVDAIAASPVAERTNLVVVSDHGLLPLVDHPVIDVSEWIDTTRVRVVDQGPYLALWFGGDSARREATYAALTKGLAASGARARVWRREETPAAWAMRDQPRAGDLIVLAEPGWIVTHRPVPPGWHIPPGDHGWDPAATRGLDAIFFAAGPNIRPSGELPAFDNVEVYPFLARMLSVEVRVGDWTGEALKGVVR